MPSRSRSIHGGHRSMPCCRTRFRPRPSPIFSSDMLTEHAAIIERIRYAGYQLVHRDRLTFVGIKVSARSHLDFSERDVHPTHELVDGHKPVTVAVADAGSGGR